MCRVLLSLLVKKVLVFLSSCESSLRHQFLPPNTYESYMYVESICADSSSRRRQETRNRAMLGIQTSKQLHQSQPMRSTPALATDAFTMPSMYGHSAETPPAVNKPIIPPPTATTELLSPAAVPAAAAALTTVDLSPNEITRDELKAVASGTLAYLKLRDPTYYVHHLVTATFCLGLAPRSQVLKQLRLGSSFVKEADGRWWVRMIGETMKNGKPTVFALPKQLTEPFDYYFATIRPELLRQHGGSDVHDFAFFKKNGTAPRKDFSELTALATTQLIGRAVNPHAFRSVTAPSSGARPKPSNARTQTRTLALSLHTVLCLVFYDIRLHAHSLTCTLDPSAMERCVLVNTLCSFRSAVITAFYEETGASDTQMGVLAQLMCHDLETAKGFYYKPKMKTAAIDASDRMLAVLDLTDRSLEASSANPVTQ